jgi:signal transduction histidine kinase
MAAGLAHELKNPLGSIHGAAQILSSHVKDNGQMAPFAQMITEETRRLNALVHQILQFSQGENFGDSFVTVDLAQLVRRTFDRIFSDQSMVLRSSLEGATLPVDGRPELLDLVMTNLFQNIKDATAGLASQDSQRIDITFQRTKDTDGKPWIKLDVSDHGPGMPRDVLDRIFIPYVTTKPGGTGLGMPLVKKALDSHGAKIHVTSQVGHGTKYSLFFRESAKLKPLGKGRNVSAHHSASLDRG